MYTYTYMYIYAQIYRHFQRVTVQPTGAKCVQRTFHLEISQTGPELDPGTSSNVNISCQRSMNKRLYRHQVHFRTTA